MNAISLESLGITKADLENRIVKKAVEDLLTGVDFDEDGDEWRTRSPIAKKIDALVKQRIDETITKLADTHILPNVASFVENLTLKATNRWGESTGTKLTFIEYLTQQADAYMREEVNYEGKPKGTDSYSWTGRTTRVAFMVDKHLHYSIEKAMQNALATANASIVGGLKGAVDKALAEVTQKLKVEVKTA